MILYFIYLKMSENDNGEIKENNPFSKSLLILDEINKDIEKEFNKNNSEDIYYLRDDIDKTMINSIFSLLNFQITIIKQLADLNSQISEKNETNQNIIEKLINFTKELLSQKIKQILMLNHNNIIFKNYIDNSSSLKIDNDKIKKRKKQIINLNAKNNFNINKTSEKINNYKKLNRTSYINNFEKNNFYDENKQLTYNNCNYLILKDNVKKKNFQTPMRFAEESKKNDIINTNPIKKRNIKNSNNKILNNTAFLKYNTSQLSKIKLKNKAKGNNKYISKESEKIFSQFPKEHPKILNNIISQDNKKEKEEINPIRKVKNIIKNIKMKSLSNNKNKNMKIMNNDNLRNGKNMNNKSIVGNYSVDSYSNQDSKIKNSFSFNEIENENANRKSYINKLTNNNNIKELETSQILHECMNNVKNRLNSKKEEQQNLDNKCTFDYKSMKHHKIKK